jgi:uncharacterized protein Yka (UPF0111/DUF47 family)
MALHLFPRNETFFDLFEQSADRVVQVAEAFRALLKDPAHFRENARAVKELEHEADKVTHAGLELLYSTFITPIDREDVHALITRLDDVADFIDAAAQRFVIYAVERVDEDLHAQAQVLVLSTERVRGGVGALRVMKKPGAIKQTLLDISKLENEGDQIFRGALAKLFASEKDPIRLIVRKELLQRRPRDRGDRAQAWLTPAPRWSSSSSDWRWSSTSSTASTTPPTRSRPSCRRASCRRAPR